MSHSCYKQRARHVPDLQKLTLSISSQSPACSACTSMPSSHSKPPWLQPSCIWARRSFSRVKSICSLDMSAAQHRTAQHTSTTRNPEVQTNYTIKTLQHRFNRLVIFKAEDAFIRSCNWVSCFFSLRGLLCQPTYEDLQLGVELLQEDNDDLQFVEGLKGDCSLCAVKPLLL